MNQTGMGQQEQPASLRTLSGEALYNAVRPVGTPIGRGRATHALSELISWVQQACTVGVTGWASVYDYLRAVLTLAVEDGVRAAFKQADAETESEMRYLRSSIRLLESCREEQGVIINGLRDELRNYRILRPGLVLGSSDAVVVPPARAREIQRDAQALAAAVQQFTDRFSNFEVQRIVELPKSL